MKHRFLIVGDPVAGWGQSRAVGHSETAGGVFEILKKAKKQFRQIWVFALQANKKYQEIDLQKLADIADSEY